MKCLRIEEARSEAHGELVGYRLTTEPGGQTLLVFADQAAMPGFRLGEAFVPSYGDRINYTPKAD